LVVSGTNNEEIASAAVALLTNLEASQKMGVAGRQWIVDNWRWEIWSKGFEELLKK
jgi:phosphatidylinositol alpha-1,6-mannosyltransferase